MVEKLIIQNFGPIKAADIDIGDLTVFVGPQATGKSLTAQLLYFFRRLEPLITQMSSNGIDTIEIALTNWFGSKLSVYADTRTKLSWSSSEYANGELQEIYWTDKGLQYNQALLARLQTPAKLMKAEVYIPSGRALYAFLPPHAIVSEFRVIRFQDWPGYISEFYGTLGRTLQWLYENRDRVNQSAKTQFLRTRIQKILKGDIEYGPETISLNIGQKLISSMTMAGGQMEIWPFWAIVESGISTKRLKSARIYFDEPEAHLHPSAQRLVVEMIAYLVQQETQFVLTTHSPYILYTINLLLKAHEVQVSGRELPETVPPEAILSPAQVAAYRFSGDGYVHNIKDVGADLIDEEELDRVADDLGATFTELLENLE